MPWESLSELLREHTNAWTIILGGLLLIWIFFASVVSKDLRMSVYIFLLAVVFTSSRYTVIHLFCYILRWLILAMIITRIFSGRSKARISTLSVLFFLWTAVAIMSAFQAPSVGRGLVFGVIYFLCFLVFFLLLSGEIVTEEHMHKWFKIFTILAWTFALLSFVVFILNPSGYTSNSGRLMGIFANPMKLCRILVFAATIFLWNGLRETGRLGKQLLYYITMLFCIFLVFLTGSRGALAGFAITVAIFALHYHKKMVVLIVPALIIGALLIVPWYLRTATKPFVRHISTLEIPERKILRGLGVQRFWERPLRGWGLGSLSDVTADVCPGYHSFHNSYLNYLVEFGVFGFVIVMLVLIWSYIRVWRLALFEAQDEYIRDVAWFFTANLTTLFAWNYYDGALSDLAEIHFYWLLILIVLIDCIVRINQELLYGQSLEYSGEVYQLYAQGTIAHV